MPTLPTMHHRNRPMTGRDPHEPSRTATPLELLFDLSFVVGFGVAAEQGAHLVADGHAAAGVIGFAFSMFAICWAWINFSWFASAFDTDDWFYRVTTMVQMIGVVILALGLPDMFESLVEGDRVHNEIMVAGYVVMRLAMLVQWLRAARQAPEYRATCMGYVWTLAITQIGWVILVLAPVSVPVFFMVGSLLAVVEMGGPWLAERIRADQPGQRSTPWHAHHMAERYGLLAIITLGEGVIGTVATLSAVTNESGWTLDAALVALAGMGLTFGLWWTYYLTPDAEMLHRHRERSWAWGYGNIVVFAGLAGVGAGLHVAAYYLAGDAHIGAVGTVLAVAVPVLVAVLADYTQFWVLTRSFDRLHMLLVAGTVLVLAAAVAAAVAGFHMSWSLLLVMLAPAVTIVGYEVRGHEHVARLLADETR
ncbi:low temperature requirement protein LtrA [Promicromonospora sp. AC04]|uniref:low temperature requirement protein A n=1 Tax=Promicromonospora sp. AC04 TaxID=2135723 RepID=UPI000D4F63C7|nr:low temperature requirement protein A [Promicromonospora sp. AC04]PUB27816.1 low temperature requirement protein LtrA [Promicromonospora sp. AC04]